MVLPGKALAGVDISLEVTPVAIGPKHLVALDRGPSCRIGDVGEHAAQRIGEVEACTVAIQGAQQASPQAVVIGVPLVGAIEVLVLLGSLLCASATEPLDNRELHQRSELRLLFGLKGSVHTYATQNHGLALLIACSQPPLLSYTPHLFLDDKV